MHLNQRKKSLIKFVCPSIPTILLLKYSANANCFFLRMRKIRKDKMTLKDPKSFLGLTSEAQQINTILIKCLMSLGDAAA